MSPVGGASSLARAFKAREAINVIGKRVFIFVLLVSVGESTMLPPARPIRGNRLFHLRGVSPNGARPFLFLSNGLPGCASRPCPASSVLHTNRESRFAIGG